MATFSFEGKDIYYEDHGSGKPLLVLNGILMSTLSWTSYIEPLSSVNRLILMDLLDQGKSARMDGPYKQDIQTEVVYGLCEHLDIERVNIMGYSYGGKVALQFALKYPQRTDRLVLFNTTAATGPWLQDIGEAWNKAAANNGEAFYLTTIPIIYSPRFYTESNDWLTRRRAWLDPLFASEDYRSAIMRLTDSGVGYDIRDRLGEIIAPTLIVSSEHDHLIPIDEQRVLVEGMPNGHHVIIARSGHGSMYETPLVFASLIYGFVNNPTLEYNIL